MSRLDQQASAAATVGRRRRLTIDEVHVENNIVTGKDQYGQTFQLTFGPYHDPVITIPKQGENWVVEQYKQEWRLKHKVEDLSKFPSLAPGDKAIAAGTLWINGGAEIDNGFLTLQDPTAPQHAATKNYVDTLVTATEANEVISVFGRTGSVSAQTGDYTVGQITGAAPLASPIFTGVPAAPTPATGDNSTKLATTAFVKNQGYVTPTTSPVTSVFSRTGAIVAASGDYTVSQITGAAPLASPTFTGVPAAPTAPVDTNTTQLATTSWVLGQSGSGNPAMDGTASGGFSSRWARQDHVHPTDTSRAPLASPTFTGDPKAPTPATGDNDTSIATTAFVKAQGYVTSTTAPVTSVFGRTGAVVAATNDYTAAQVTNAADKASSSVQAFNATVQTSGSFWVLGGPFANLNQAAGSWALQFNVGSDSQPSFFSTNQGAFNWGPGGSTATDTALYRSGVNTLYSPGNISLGNSLIANSFSIAGRGTLNTGTKEIFLGDVYGDSGVPGLRLGGDTYLYRSAANMLTTDGSLGIGTGATAPTNAIEIATNSTVDPSAGLLKGLTITNQNTTSSALDGILFRGWDTTSLPRHGAAIVAGPESTWTGGSGVYPGFLSFWTRTSGSNEAEAVRITSTQYVGIGTTSPKTKLQVNAKVVDDNSFSYDSNSLTVVHQTPTATATLNDPKTTLMLARQGTASQAYGAAAAFNLSRYENVGTNSRTRLDISLAHGSFDVTSNTAMTLLSSGNVGIGETNPSNKLQLASSTSSTGGIGFGSDTNLYRESANILKTAGYFKAGSYIQANADATGATILGYVNGSTTSGLSFGTGSAWDTNLYRYAAGILGTDSAIRVGTNTSGAAGLVTVFTPTAANSAFLVYRTTEANATFQIVNDGKHNWGPGSGSAADTNLYRSAAGTLKTDGAILAGNSITAVNVMLGNDVNGQIEIGRQDGTAGTPYMDWHSGATAVDFDVRMMVTGGTGVSGHGNLNITANAIQLNGAPIVYSFNSRTGAVAPASGDYTAAQVTNAADKSSASTQAFSANVSSTGQFTASGGLGFQSNIANTSSWAQSVTVQGTAGNTIFGVYGQTLYWSDPGGGSGVDTSLYRNAANQLRTGGYFQADSAIMATGGSSVIGAGAALQGNNTYSAGNNWMSGMVGSGIYYDGANWQNKTFGGNNGWAAMAVRGASTPGGFDFYGVNATGATDRSYTPAQFVAQNFGSWTTDGTLTTLGRVFSGAAGTGGMWVDGGSSQFVGSNSSTLMGLYNSGWQFLVSSGGKFTIGGAADTFIQSKYSEAGSIQLAGSNNYGVLYLGSTAGGYIRPLGQGLRICDGGSSSVAQVGFFGATPVAQQTAHAVTTNTRGVGTTWLVDNTTTGGVGSTAYTIPDIVAAMKNLGLLAA